MSRVHILICLATLLSLPGHSAAAEPRKPALTSEQRQELQGLIVEFRQVRAAPEKRLDVIDRMAKLGPIGLTNLLEVINLEFVKQLSDYRQAFMKAAAAIVVQRTQQANVQEIARLRAEVLDLSNDDGLTKQQIVKIADPALAQLKKLILISPQEVLESNPLLVARREKLGTLGSQWEKCATLLLAAQFEEDQKNLPREDAPAGASAVPGNPAPSDPAPGNSVATKPADDQVEVVKPPSFAAYLAKEEELATSLAMPMDPQTRSVLAANAKLVGRIDPEEARCVLDLNLTRNLLGLDALKIDLELTAAARDHSTDMATLKFFDHESPVPGKKEPSDRAQRFGTSASGENIAMGTLDGAVANEMWWHSPGHHRNMLGDHQRVGLGKYGRHWTELFGD